MKGSNGVSYDYLENKDRYRNCRERVYSTCAGSRCERLFMPDRYGVDYVWEGADGGNKDAFNKYSNQLNSSFGMLYEFWENAYKGITRANTALMYLPKVGDMTDAEKTAREGELRFMRAYFYFDLVQKFGRIPLLSEGNVSQIITDFRLASFADLYAFIISDLRYSFDVLPDVAMQADRGRATKWAGQLTCFRKST